VNTNPEPGTRNPEPEISIVIVTWNGRAFLEPCLSAVAAQEGVDAEVIVVDNGSTDGTVAYVRERFPWVRLVALEQNRGFAGGNNAGARVSRGRYIALLNNDTVPDGGWLRALRGGVDEAAGYALITSRIVYMHDPDIVDSAGDGCCGGAAPSSGIMAPRRLMPRNRRRCSASAARPA
jgi:GT2 family glycosyltransferase